MRVVLAASVIAIFGSAAALLACRAQIPKPELGVHVATDRGVCVPFPPPAARADEIPPRVDPASVWIDGEWAWGRRRWRWHKGRWEVPPSGALYARPTSLRLENGALAHFPGHWYTPELTSPDAAIDVIEVERSLQCPAPAREDAGAHDVDAASLDASPSTSSDAGPDAPNDGSGVTDAHVDDEPPWLGDAPLPIIPPPK